MKKKFSLIFSMALCVILAVCNNNQAVDINSNSENLPLPASPTALATVTVTPAEPDKPVDNLDDMYNAYFTVLENQIQHLYLTEENISQKANVKSEVETLVSEIKSLFEEADNRSFDISFPIKIEGEDFYKIVVSGKLKSNQTYPIDIIAVNPNGDKRYFLNKETNIFVRFYTTPTFACKTSPDKKLRIESVGMYQDGPSGLHSLKDMRIINTLTGNVLWSASGFLTNEFVWSEDSRYVAAGYAGRQWMKTDIIDTKDYSVIHIPNMDDILKVVPNTSKPNDNASVPIFKVSNWLSPSIICIQFQWITNTDIVVSGEYEYDIVNNEMSIKEIDEESGG